MLANDIPIYDCASGIEGSTTGAGAGVGVGITGVGIGVGVGCGMIGVRIGDGIGSGVGVGFVGVEDDIGDFVGGIITGDIEVSWVVMGGFPSVIEGVVVGMVVPVVVVGSAIATPLVFGSLCERYSTERGRCRSTKTPTTTAVTSNSSTAIENGERRLVLGRIMCCDARIGMV